MKRKQFIRNISLVGAGIGLAPTALFGSSHSSRIALPTAAVHIPHGNFATVNCSPVEISEMNLAVSVQKFLKDGITKSEYDLTVYTFKGKNEVLNVGLNSKGCWHSGSLKGVELSSFHPGFTLQNEAYRISIELDNLDIKLVQLG